MRVTVHGSCQFGISEASQVKSFSGENIFMVNRSKNLLPFFFSVVGILSLQQVRAMSWGLNFVSKEFS